MPQLMPLFWMISTFILLFIILMMVLLYSYSYLVMDKLFVSNNSFKYFWCW